MKIESVIIIIMRVVIMISIITTIVTLWISILKDRQDKFSNKSLLKNDYSLEDALDRWHDAELQLQRKEKMSSSERPNK